MTDPDRQRRRLGIETSVRHQVRILKEALRGAAGNSEKEDAAVNLLTTHLLRNAIPFSLGLGVVVQLATDRTQQRRTVTNVACSFGHVIYELDRANPYYRREDLVFVEHATPESLQAIS